MQTMNRTTGAIEHKGMEYKLCFGEIKEMNDAKYQFSGHISVKNNLDYGRDIVRNGAYYRTLTDAFKRKAAGEPFLYNYLWNHDSSQIPPGGIYDGEEDKTGMRVWVALNPEVQLARELYASLKMKTLSRQSVGYLAPSVNWTKGEDGKGQVREILEMDVKEGSCVIFAMNDMARVDQVKQRYWPGYTFDNEAKENRVMSTRTISVLRKATAGIESHVGAINSHLAAARQNAISGFPVYSASNDEPYDVLSALEALNAELEGKSGAAISEANHVKIAAATANIMKHVKIIKDAVHQADDFNRLAGQPVYHASSSQEFESKEEDPAITELRSLRESLGAPSPRSLESRMDEIDARIGVELALAALIASE
jgi:HK97 family phage prohead protease